MMKQTHLPKALEIFPGSWATPPAVYATDCLTRARRNVGFHRGNVEESHKRGVFRAAWLLQTNESERMKTPR
jgi:hypothetical protein